MPERRELTLFDYVPYVPGLDKLGLSEDELKQIPAHEDVYVGSAEGGGMVAIGDLPPDAPTASPSPISAAGTRRLYAYEPEMPPELWRKLSAALFSSGPSGYEKEGLFTGTPDVVISDEDRQEQA